MPRLEKEQLSDEERTRIQDLRNRAASRKLKIGEMERELPAGSNGLGSCFFGLEVD